MLIAYLTPFATVQLCFSICFSSLGLKNSSPHLDRWASIICHLSLPCSHAQTTNIHNPLSALQCFLLPLSPLIICSWSSPDLALPSPPLPPTFHRQVSPPAPMAQLHLLFPPFLHFLPWAAPSMLNSWPSHFSFSFTTSLANKASYALTESHVSRNDSLPPPLTDSFSHLFLPRFTLPNRTHLLLHRISPTHFELKLSGFPKLLPFQDFSSSAGHVIYAIHSKQTNTSLVSSKLVF